MSTSPPILPNDIIVACLGCLVPPLSVQSPLPKTHHHRRGSRSPAEGGQGGGTDWRTASVGRWHCPPAEGERRGFLGLCVEGGTSGRGIPAATPSPRFKEATGASLVQKPKRCEMRAPSAIEKKRPIENSPNFVLDSEDGQKSQNGACGGRS